MGQSTNSPSQPEQQVRSIEDIRRILRRSMPEARRRWKVRSMGVFGSYVRGEAHATSDLDVLVEFDEAPSLLEYIFLEEYLSVQVGLKVDLVMKKALRPRIGKRILDEVVPV
jgi:hypothetical protein